MRHVWTKPKTRQFIECLKAKYPLQGVTLLEYYVGGNFKVQKKDRGDTTTVCARTYVSKICQRIEELFSIQLKSYENPMASDDHPEIDDSGLLNHADHSRFMTTICSTLYYC